MSTVFGFRVLPLVAALVFASGAASAAVQVYNFTATVNPASQGSDLTGANAAVTGQFSFDDAVAPSGGPYSSGATWYPALLSFSFNVAGGLSGSLTGVPPLSDSVHTWNNFTGAPLDGFFIDAQPMAGPARLGNALISADLGLADSTGTVFSNSNLPASLSLAQFDGRLLHVSYATGTADFYATIDTLVSAVPEPSTLVMFAASLAALGFLAKRRKPG